jgi:hypothetical protein
LPRQQIVGKQNGGKEDKELDRRERQLLLRELAAWIAGDKAVRVAACYSEFQDYRNRGLRVCISQTRRP